MKSILVAAFVTALPMIAQAQSEPAATAPDSAAPDEAKALVQALEAKYARVEAQRKSTAPANVAAKGAEKPLAAGLEMLALALLVGGALGGGAWWLKKRQRAESADPTSRNLSVSDALWLGKGQRLVLVDVAGQSVLIGVSSAGMQSLAVLDPKRSASPGVTETVAPAVGRIKTTAIPESEEWFSEMVRDEMTRDRPSRDDRRRILSQLNSL